MRTSLFALIAAASLGVWTPAASAASADAYFQANTVSSQTAPVRTIDDGTGYSGPGSLTGGPSGGLPNRN